MGLASRWRKHSKLIGPTCGSAILIVLILASSFSAATPLPVETIKHIHQNISRAGDLPRPKIAIVIDDLGYSVDSIRTLAALPFPLTFAVIPDTPFEKRVIDITLKHEQELILHIPMQAKGKKHWEEGLNLDQEKSVFTERLITMLKQHPSISGINNHGGSLLTADRERMDWIMVELARRELYFLDSRTTNESRAIEAANDHAVQNLSRDVFLDNIRTKEAIDSAFQHVRNIARKTGQAIAIGHPHALTIEQLKVQLPALVEEGFELSFCSDLLTSVTEAPTLGKKENHTKKLSSRQNEPNSDNLVE